MALVRCRKPHAYSWQMATDCAMKQMTQDTNAALFYTGNTANCQHLSQRVHSCMTKAHSSLERFLLWNMVCLRAAMRAAEPRRVAALKATLP